MRILILGDSAIARKRLLPALATLSEVTGVEVASRSASGAAFSDYESALAKSDADLVYVSLVNSSHALWAERALDTGRHVVVDKPAFLEREQAERLVELSRSRRLCLAEATAYTRHPQLTAIRDLFVRSGDAPRSIVATFSFPPLDAENFRYRKALGGGALYDLGPYAVSPGRLFWGERPAEVECRILSTAGPDDVETSFSVLMIYTGGRALVGQFGFATAYRNRLSLLGNHRCVDVDRVFTTPASLDNELRVSQEGEVSVVKTPAADSFALFMKEVLAKIATRDLEGLRAELLEDALLLERMRRSALES
ncbi:MAG: Gfo/Idh/MocA family oxidoreductase [Candidatus Binatia bacterium]|nr:Gfo/Idh/MocA family oxidoreductase [Candidatus Binatia bacterium]